MDTTERIYRVLKGTASPEEKQELEQWIASSEGNRDEFDNIKLLLDPEDDTIEEPEEKPYDGLPGILESIRVYGETQKKKWFWLVFILTMILIISLFIFFSARENNGFRKGGSNSLTQVTSR